MALRALSLCAGIGGLDLGLRPYGVRTVAYVEREAYAAAVLVQAMEEGWLDAGPIWSDLATFDTRAWRGAVDLITAGFPCQPVSCAGKRLGTEDERWLWPYVLRIVDEIQPAVVFLESTPGILVRGGVEVAGSLAGRGYRVAWDCVSAAQLGAPHLRFRWFCLAANPDRAGCLERWRSESGRGIRTSEAAKPLRVSHNTRRRVWWSESGAQTWRGDQGIPEPVLCGVDARLPARAHRLHVLGNSVVPAQAAFAWRELWRRMRR